MSSQKFLLTYSQINLATFDEAELGAYLTNLCDGNIQQVLVARERHQNGGHHIHVYLDVGKVISVTNCRFFDYSARHCNIRKVWRTPEKVVSYVRKDGNIVYDFEKSAFDEFLRLSAIEVTL